MTPLFYRHPPALFLLAAALFVLTSGCVIHLTAGPGPDGAGGSGGDTPAPPPPDSTSAGQGGACPAGSSSAGNGGAGGGGGGCVGPDGTGETSAVCDTMEISPSAVGGPAASNCDICGSTGGVDPPPGWILCLHAFQILTPGSAEYLQTCLVQINGAPAYACDYGPVNDCVTRMYDATCPSQAAADTCQAIEYALCGTNDPFDVNGCTEELKPFDASALQWVEVCIASSSEPDCVTAYNACFTQITSY